MTAKTRRSDQARRHPGGRLFCIDRNAGRSGGQLPRDTQAKMRRE